MSLEHCCCRAESRSRKPTIFEHRAPSIGANLLSIPLQSERRGMIRKWVTKTIYEHRAPSIDANLLFHYKVNAVYQQGSEIGTLRDPWGELCFQHDKTDGAVIKKCVLVGKR